VKKGFYENMSGFNWSKEQESAINHSTGESGSAIVSAAAGSGKTAMLVERIIRIITNQALQIPADKIVAVTFTNDAAGELKVRLEDAISKIIADSETPWLKEQLINLENAPICTISSFCIRILRDYAEEINLKPDFRICEGKERELYSKLALNYALEAVYDEGVFKSDEKAALRFLTGETGDSKLGRAVLELHEEYVKQPFPERWLCEKAALYNYPDGFKDLLINDAQRQIKKDAHSCLEYIEECAMLSYNEKMTERLCADRAFALSWAKADLSRGEKGLLEYGNSYYGNVSEINKPAKEQIKTLRDIYIPVFKEIIVTAGTLLDFELVIKKQACQVKALKRLFELYRDRFSELKIEADCVDFSDAEHYVLKLLQADKIQESYHEIIVDEFQDSNAVQYEIFKGISKGGKNLFFVGDVKQSIYRFRNADQRVFTSVTEDENFTTLTLNKNYRSSEEVVRAVNVIFEGTMTKETGGADYDDSAKLIFGTGITGGAAYEAELVITDTEEGGDVSVKTAEAAYIANRIAEMVGNGFTVADRDGSRRPCNYGDFAVLISQLSTVEEEFGAAFEERAIPYDKQKSGDYTEVLEIKTIIALLTVIERPFEDLELLAVLMSPLYNFTAADIAEVRVSNVNKPLFDNLVGTSGSHEKVTGFLNDYRRWSAYSKNHGACKLVRLIYNEGGFNPLAASSVNPEKTMTNIRLMLYYSENLKNMTRDTLSGLVSVLGEKSIVTLEEARYSGEAENNKVKLMTIHASKGLEFPICFVARTGARFNLRENYSDIIFSDRIGFAMRYIIPETRTRCDTLIHKKTREENQSAIRAEEMRKLYVACTRAKDKLILTGVREREKVTENSYLNWLMQTDINKKIEESGSVSVHTAAPAPLQLYNQTETHEIIAAVEKTYPRELLTRIPRRVTATQIGAQQAVLSEYNDETQDEPTIFPRGASFMGNRKLTGKKRGDAYHKMMELIDFKAGDYETQMKKHKSCFTEEEFAIVEVEKIIGFFASSLGRRAVISPKVQKEFKLCTEISISELGYPIEYDENFNEKPFVQGIADMFFYENGGIILVDYKTNRNTARDKLAGQYKKQLEIYAKAIEEMTGVQVREKWIYSFELGEIKVED
jgi:ATP-dependent helicase/nuclease subunit A